jgi:hypothetical protein
LEKRKKSHHCPCPEMNSGNPSRSSFSIPTELPRFKNNHNKSTQLLFLLEEEEEEAKTAKMFVRHLEQHERILLLFQCQY